MEGSRSPTDRFFLPVFLVLAAILATGLFFLAKKSLTPRAKPPNTTGKEVVKRISPVPSAQTLGTMSLSADAPFPIPYGKTVPVLLIADSRNVPLVGYDAVLEYDPDYLAYEGTDNPMPTVFAVREKAGEGTVAVSGSLADMETKPFASRSAVLASLRFKTLRPGRSQITIRYEKGSTSDSNLTDTSSHDVLGEVISLDVAVGQEFRLIKGETREISGTDYRVTLIDVIKPETNCPDCMEKADLELIDRKGKAQAFSFSQGGFAGNVPNDVRLSGFLIAISMFGKSGVTIFVVPE